jgi:hypothetical protein
MFGESGGGKDMTPKFWILQATGLAVMVLSLGLLLPVLSDDSTFMSHGITLLLPLGLFLAARGHPRHALQCGRYAVALGLLGTVIGFRVALSGVDPATAGDASAIQPMIGGLIDGMGTALSTTIVGLLVSLWLRTTVWLTGVGHE